MQPILPTGRQSVGKSLAILVRYRVLGVGFGEAGQSQAAGVAVSAGRPVGGWVVAAMRQ